MTIHPVTFKTPAQFLCLVPASHEIPKFKLPSKGIEPDTAYQLIHDVRTSHICPSWLSSAVDQLSKLTKPLQHFQILELDGKENANLASFVNTWGPVSFLVQRTPLEKIHRLIWFTYSEKFIIRNKPCNYASKTWARTWLTRCADLPSWFSRWIHITFRATFWLMPKKTPRGNVNRTNILKHRYDVMIPFHRVSSVTDMPNVFPLHSADPPHPMHFNACPCLARARLIQRYR
jgi:hypothetical protein